MKKYINALKGLCYSSARYALRKRSLGELEYASCVAAGAVEKIPSREIRSLPGIWPGRLYDLPEEITLRIGRHEDGSMPLEDLVVLLYLLKREKPLEVFEIGTFMGQTTRAMAENCPESIVHTLDLPPDFDKGSDLTPLPKDDFHLIEHRTVGREFEGLPCAVRIRQHYGDSAIWDFTPVKGASFFFIDGAHTYEYIKNDTEKCFEVSEKAGTFLWHDVDDRHSGVLRYLLELRRDGYDVVRLYGTQLAYLKLEKKGR